MGTDTKTCQLCSHAATTTRRHKEHCRGHFLQYVCPCGYCSHSKETTRKHQLKAAKTGVTSRCTTSTLFTVDEDTFAEWKRATGVALAQFPRRNTLPTPPPRIKAPTPEVRIATVKTPPRRDGRSVVGYKQPSTTMYNSSIRPSTSLPSRIEVVNDYEREKATRRPYKEKCRKQYKEDRVSQAFKEMRQLRDELNRQYDALSHSQRKVDNIIRKLSNSN